MRKFLRYLTLLMVFVAPLSFAQVPLNLPDLDDDVAQESTRNSELNDIIVGGGDGLFTPEDNGNSDDVISGFCNDVESCIDDNPAFEDYYDPVVSPDLVDGLLQDYTEGFDFGTITDGGIDVPICVPPGTNTESTGANEYRCFSGPEFTESIEACDRIIRAGVMGDVVYNCEVTYDEDGNEIRSPECDVLAESDICDETSRNCTSNAAATFDVSCSTGPSDVNIEEGCDLATFHFLQVFEAFDCAYTLDIENRAWVPTVECLERIDDRECTDLDVTCVEINDAVRVPVTCQIGETLGRDDIECLRTPQYVARETFIWNVTRDFDASLLPEFSYVSRGQINGRDVDSARFILEEQRDCSVSLSCDDGGQSCLQLDTSVILLEARCPDFYEYPFFINGSGTFEVLTIKEGELPFVKSDDYLEAESSSCTFSDEECLSDEPLRERSLSCEFGHVDNESSAVCSSFAEVNIDTDYIYVGHEVFDASYVDHLPDLAFSQLTESIDCVSGATQCVQEAPPVFEELVCLSGFVEQINNEFCRVPVDIVIDHDYLYSASRHYDVVSEEFVPDSAHNLLVANDCTQFESECVEESSSTIEIRECRDGFERDFTLEDEVVSRVVTVETDYRYSAFRSFDVDTESFVSDASKLRLVAEEESRNCSLRDEVCTVPSGGVFETFECREGYFERYEDHSCLGLSVIPSQSDYVYEVYGDYNFTQERREYDGQYSQLLGNSECNLSFSECVVESSGFTEAFECEFGTYTTYNEVRIDLELEVVVDADYIYQVATDLDIASGEFVTEDRYSGIFDDVSCQSTSSECLEQYSGPLNGYSCQIGTLVEDVTFSCDKDLVLGLETTYQYSVLVSFNGAEFGNHTVFRNALEASPLCEFRDQSCFAGFEDECGIAFDNYVCSEDIGLGINPIPISVITDETYDTTECDAALENYDDLSCELVSDIEAPETTQNIGGVDVTRSFKRTQTWSCVDGGTSEAINTCEYDTSLMDSECLSEINGNCVLTEYTASNDNFPVTPVCQDFGFTFRCDEETYGESDFRQVEVVSENYVRTESLNSSEGCFFRNRDFGPIETRNFLGLELTRRFEFTNVYACPETEDVNTCEGIDFDDPPEFERECVRTIIGGDCELYEYTFQLEAEDPSGGCDVVREEFSCSTPLNSVGGLVSAPADSLVDGLYLPSCEVDSFDGVCEVSSETCSVGQGSLRANGSDVSFDCLRQTVNYDCVETSPTLSCDVPDGYELFSSECDFTDRSGNCTLEDRVYRVEAFDASFGCHEYQSDYVCDNVVSGLDVVEEIKYVSGSALDNSYFFDLRRGYDACVLESFSCAHGPDESLRNVDGLDVYFACWDFDRVWSCHNDTDFDECDAVNDNAVISSECIADIDGVCTGFLRSYEEVIPDTIGGCIEFEDRFVCEDEISELSYYEVVSRLDDVSRDESACEGIDEDYDFCRQIQTLCLDDPGTRNIEGVDVELDCFEFQYVYECSREVDTQVCEPPAHSDLVTRVCESFDRNGNCTLYNNTYRFEVDHPSGGCLDFATDFRCEEIQENLSYVETVSHEDGFVWNDDACDAYNDNEACTISTSCVSGPETRIIQGVSVERDCWEREHVVECISQLPVDSCVVPSDATLISENCANDNFGGSCSLFNRSYEWVEYDGSGGCHSFGSVASCDSSDAVARSYDDLSVEYVEDNFIGDCPSSDDAANDNCVVEEVICLDGEPNLRVPEFIVDVNGAVLSSASLAVAPSVSRECWNEQVTYSCDVGTPVDECTALTSGFNIRKCEFESQRCLNGDEDDCSLYERTYECNQPGTGICVERNYVTECPLIESGLAVNDNTPLVSSSDTNYRVEVIGEGLRSECETDRLDSECEVISEVCSEPNSDFISVTSTQSEFYDQFIGFAPEVRPSCLSTRREYACSYSSSVDSCDGVEGCALTSETCEIRDVFGNCITYVSDYSCEEASCQLSNLTYDPRGGDSSYVGHHYTCRVSSTVTIDHDSSGEPEPRGELPSTVNNACLDTAVNGCFSQLRVNQLDESLNQVSEGPTRFRPTGHDFLQEEFTGTLIYDVYCPSQVGLPLLEYVGYSDGFSSDVDSLSDLSLSDDCELLESECLSVYRRSFGGHITEEDCLIPGRATYQCFGDGNGGLCEGSCESETVTYSCDGEVAGAGEGDVSDREIGSSEESTCGEYETDENCVVISEVCVEGSEERIVDGVPIFNECWRTEVTYQCVQTTGTTSDCEPAPECELSEQLCISYDSNGDCNTIEFVYDCSAEETVMECEDDNGLDQDTDDPNESDGQSNNEPGLFDIISAVDGTNAGTDDSVNDPSIFGGDRLDCRRDIAGVRNCCRFSGPLLLLGCNSEETRLQGARQEDQCIENGSYCSRRALFFCRQRSRAFCCYDSALIRIIVEAGNQQLGRDLGDAEDTDCRGFSFDEFASLDLSVVDFSGVAQNVLDNANMADGETFEERIRNSFDNLQQRSGSNLSDLSGG